MRAHRRNRARATGGRDRGVFTVELAAIAPLWLMLTALFLQAFIAFATVGFTHHAAREAARAAEVGADGRAAALADLPGPWRARASVASGAGGAKVTIAVPQTVPVYAQTITASAGGVTDWPRMEGTVEIWEKDGTGTVGGSDDEESEE